LLEAILKKIVAKFRPETLDELKQVLLDAWNAIPQKTINKLCQGFFTQLEICLEMNGQSTSKQLCRCCDKSTGGQSCLSVGAQDGNEIDHDQQGACLEIELHCR
jgi:hypothetical protein